MNYIIHGFIRAFDLLISFDPETYSAILTTLKVSILSITGALFLGIPAGFILGYYRFPLRNFLKLIFDSLLAVPTVVIGLFVYALISSRGPLGNFGLLYTVYGIALAQVFLILPIVVSLISSGIARIDSYIRVNAVSLGAGNGRIALTVLWEARGIILMSAIAAYSRAISEVGVSMMIGGNIKWFTRTITTAIALEAGRGNFATGIALGIVLLLLSLLLNILIRVVDRDLR